MGDRGAAASREQGRRTAANLRSLGVNVDLAPVLDRDGIDAFTALYSESTARALVTVRSEADLATVVGIAQTHGVPIARLGTTDGDRLKVKDVLDLPLEQMREAHTGTMQRYFG